LLLAGLTLLVLIVIAMALAVFRYIPAYEAARSLRGDLEQLVDQAKEAGLELDRTDLETLEGELATVTEHFDGLTELLANDPLVAIARGLPQTAANVRGADTIASVAGDLLDAAADGLDIGRRYVEIKEAQAADPSTASAFSSLVELVATSRDRAVALAATVSRARQMLADVPDGLAGPLEDARDTMVARLEEYAPILDSIVEVSEPLPAILGWDAPRRYLILTQNPAELRPTGGYIGSYGIVGFDKGRITERRFQDISSLDLPWDYPFIRGPQELHDYLLGEKQPWQLADSNWSPDFPTSAQDAIRLYLNESGDDQIDGVLAITTYTIDELLKVTGPIGIPGYHITVASGETTLKLLQAIWSAADAGSPNRKAILGPFAEQLFTSLLGLAPARWGQLIDEAEMFRQRGLLVAWFRDPASQKFVETAGFDGSVRREPGDYIYPVDSNVAPTSKLNAVTTRALDLNVQLDEFGNAEDSLTIRWQNDIETPAAAPYRDLPIVGHLRILGMYSRLLLPERSRLGEISGGSYVALSDPAVVEEQADGLVVGTYLKLPPGSTDLTYRWTSPYAADTDETGGTYRLTLQHQPGILPGPITIAIRVPPGTTISSASPGLTVDGDVATMASLFDRDLTLELAYAPAAGP
jgi:Protein of unknown function (DUF4012)